VRAEPVAGRAALLRNTPTLQHAALQPALHADGRLAFLEDQVRDVVHNPDEMAGDLERVAAAWRSDAVRRAAFARTFGGPADSGAVTSRRIASALAAYVRSLPVTDAAFDRALRGDTAAISAEARRGFNVYMGKATCGTCHFAPLFNGVVPTRYTEVEYEVIGVPGRAVWRGARVDADSGRGPLNGNPLHAFAFKTPTVRHSARTAPYMHNGVYRTLEEVIRFYNLGGGDAIGAVTAHQTLPADPLDLTDREIADLIAFLRALD
jgi:cytochrome c peroxidase